MEKYKKTLAGIERTDNQPFEKNVVFSNAAALTTYLQNDPTKYNGQLVIVSGNGTNSKGTIYRLDQAGNTWKAVPLGDSEDMATKVQGSKADTAVQSATIGGVAVTKSGTTLQLPAYPTSLPSSDKATILAEAATAAQAKVDAHASDNVAHVTQIDRNNWNSKETVPHAQEVANAAAAAAIKTNVTDKKGVAGGLATLDENSKIPSSQLPSYVDDVVELLIFSSLPSVPKEGDRYYNTASKLIFYYHNNRWDEGETPESGKIYVTLNDNRTYRWSGSDMTEISKSLALGETSSTAYPGDKGKLNATNIDTLFKDKLDKDGESSGTWSLIVDPEIGVRPPLEESYLELMFGVIKRWLDSLKPLAFKDEVDHGDIANGAIGSNNLDSSLGGIISTATLKSMILCEFEVHTFESADDHDTLLYQGFCSAGSNLMFEGIKGEILIKLINYPQDGNHIVVYPRDISILLRDEAGHMVTDMFTRVKEDASDESNINYRYMSTVDIGTIYFSVITE